MAYGTTDSPGEEQSQGNNIQTAPNDQTAQARGSESPSPNHDEENPLLDSDQTSQKVASISSIIAVLLLGEFISNADATIIMAAAGPIASQFNRLHDANWLSTAYTLGSCASQPIYGKLSDIYGRKPLLLVSYFLLALGCVICGIGQVMPIVILGRIISGMGGAGIMAMSAIIITDIVPKRDVASWRAYVNIAMTLGRSVGGPIGGWLTDTIGWRWLFLLQAPFLGLASLLVVIFLQGLHTHKTSAQPDKNISPIRRVDFLGTGVLAVSIVAIILLFDRGGQAFLWLSGYALGLALTGILALTLFVYVENHVAPEPIFDLRIFRDPNIIPSYLIGGLQTSAQVGMMFTVPLYFQVMTGTTSTVAGAHLVPAVVGNTIGGLLAGAFIRRTGRYKPVLIAAGIAASVSYVLQFYLWNGHTGFWGSLYIVPGGMGTAFAAAAAFVSMTSFLEPVDIAMATGGYILFSTFSVTAGVTATNTVLGITFKRDMEQGLKGLPDKEEIIRRAMSDTSYIAGLTGRVRDIVLQSYLSGLRGTYIISFASSIAGSLIAWTVRDCHLD
ncbi:tetracycline-efflux transporter, putative [Talaromyces stipitatus ATCC 10500]|uniref:Tetracycline-efflux transporter, putative n=1 Tax=Talaromyces stipitatus (strain ATCC 10500 / CBS 375.48 / QM 6759 / NRRL 1006) TaxID=441959 RepID=B8MIE6_TALSN|nr:tetracycline-efflux transporter, putative [Talaromyces stipitatus ATCC 10500]EED14630.1 tetracycline-efflux transporter, putative [Talaromyces stipitatus ATCC 10500]